MTGEALPAEHNGDIWSREATKHGAILTGKIQRFLLGVSIRPPIRKMMAHTRNMMPAPKPPSLIAHRDMAKASPAMLNLPINRQHSFWRSQPFGLFLLPDKRKNQPQGRGDPGIAKAALGKIQRKGKARIHCYILFPIHLLIIFRGGSAAGHGRQLCGRSQCLCGQSSFPAVHQS